MWYGIAQYGMVWYGFQDSWSKDTWSKDTWYKGQKVQRQMVQSDTWYNRQKVHCFVKPDKRSKRQKVLSDKMFKIYSVFFLWCSGLLGWWPFELWPFGVAPPIVIFCISGFWKKFYSVNFNPKILRFFSQHKITKLKKLSSKNIFKKYFFS